jgi:polyhydroxybutyrate depolymerase
MLSKTAHLWLLASLVPLLPAPLAACRAGGRMQEKGKLPAAGQEQRAAKLGLETFTLTHGERERACHLRLPPGHSTDKSWPLLIALHGGGGTGAGFDRFMTGGTLGEAAASAGFIALYPEAFEEHWNDGRGMSWASHQLDVDDVGFLVALIDHAVQTFKADPKRVFVAGMSNGAQMTYRLLQEVPERFAAAAAVVSDLPRKRADVSPKGSVPLLIFNGTQDPLMPFEGGEASIGAGRTKQTVDFLSAEETARYWIKHAGISSEAKVEKLPDADPSDGTTVQRKTWEGKQGPQVVLYVIEGGGHAWPGGTQYYPEARIGKVSRDISASELIVAFFASHAGR